MLSVRTLIIENIHDFFFVECFPDIYDFWTRNLKTTAFKRSNIYTIKYFRNVHDKKNIVLQKNVILYMLALGQYQ